MTTKSPPSLAPKVRFPAFRAAGDWVFSPLGSVAEPITEKVGTDKCVPMSVTAGVGLVSQEAKFGRIIAGASYKDYIKLKQHDFAYNKSATKDFPQGYIALYSGKVDAGVPNSIFTCFRPRVDRIIPEYLDHWFRGNYHGRWLRKYITVGARAHGALNVRDDDLYAMPVPLPPAIVALEEQRKIAGLLGSLDDLIAAERTRLEALRQHKRGLIQRLFPRLGDTVPRLRIPDCHDDEPWERAPLGDIAEITLGKMLDRSRHDTGQLLPYLNNNAVRWNGFDTTNLPRMYFRDDEVDRYGLRAGDVLVCEGGEPGRAAIWDDRLPGVKFQKALHRVRFRVPYDPRILVLYLEAVTGTSAFERRFTGGGIKHLTRASISRLEVPVCSIEEQTALADCLSSAGDCIAGTERQLEVLTAHKKGLLQRIFPSMESNWR